MWVGIKLGKVYGQNSSWFTNFKEIFSTRINSTNLRAAMTCWPFLSTRRDSTVDLLPNWYGWMCRWFWALRPLQQHFSHSRTMDGWAWRALCNGTPFRFGKNLASSGIRTRDLVIRSREPRGRFFRTGDSFVNTWFLSLHLKSLHDSNFI